MVRRWWERRHVLTRLVVDRAIWPHPRPPADPRVVGLNLSLAGLAIVQAVFNPPESSVAYKAYTDPALIATTVLILVAAGLVLAAAVVQSQFTSWALEAAGTALWVCSYTLSVFALVAVNPEWWKTANLAWALGLGGGNAWRCAILARRLW